MPFMRFILTLTFISLLYCCCLGQYYFEDIAKSETANFSKIKRQVKKSSEFNSTSVDVIAKSISQIASTDLEKVYAIYYWVSHIITYDMISFEAGRQVPYAPSKVLKNKLAVCSGYAYLFKA